MPNPFLLRLEAHASLSIKHRREIEALTSRVDRLGSRVAIVRGGEEADVVNVLLSGWACLHRVLPDGRRQITTLFLPGDLCGSGFFLPGIVEPSLSTLTPVTVAKMPISAIRGMAASSSDLAEALQWQALIAVSIQRERTVSFGQRSALERIAHLVCEIWTRLDMVGLADHLECDFPITQAELAEATGLSAVHVNRVVRDMRTHGLAELREKRIVILDQEKLARIAMFDPAYLHRPPA